MKIKFSYAAAEMVLSLVSIPLCCIVAHSYHLGVLIAVLSLLILPLGKEDAAVSFYYSLAVICMALVSSLAGLSHHIVPKLPCAGLIFFLCYRLMYTYRCMDGLFKQGAVKTALASQLRLLYSSACVFLGSCGQHVLISILLTLLYGVLAYRVYTGRLMIILTKTESTMTEIIRGNLRPEAPVRKSDGTDNRMWELYGKIVRCMEEEKPFLDPNFSEADMLQYVLTNKSYLSRTVNVCSGMNFKQFVNSYRIRYAVELMKGDRRLKVRELSRMSGFNNVVTFNMAFKLFVGVTPGEFNPS